VHYKITVVLFAATANKFRSFSRFCPRTFAAFSLY